MTPPNVFEPEFDADQERPGFTYRRARVARQDYWEGEEPPPEE